MASLFTKIVQGEIPCHKLLEDDRYLSFLDVRPIKAGHALVIPKEEIDYIFDVKDDLLAGLHLFSKRVAKMIEKEVECERIGVMVAGLEVRHTHIHLIPMTSTADLNFANAKDALQEDLSELAQKIRAHQ